MIPQLVECPRDAWQGKKTFVPTPTKTAYLQALLKVGFDVLDCGSFVSPKAMPQMADTAQVLSQLDLRDTTTQLLAIVANERGGADALALDTISFLGYPFSLSPTFQQRNTNSTQSAALALVGALQNKVAQKHKSLVVYLSMGFGNPYGDAYHPDLLLEWAQKIQDLGVTRLSLADTVGLASPAAIEQALHTLVPAFPQVHFGVHLHADAHNRKEKLAAALRAGAKSVDGAIGGFGGCPMAQDELVGNLDTMWLAREWDQRFPQHKLSWPALLACQAMAGNIFTADN